MDMPLPGRFSGKKGTLRYFVDRLDSDLTQYWNTLDYTSNPVTLPIQTCENSFAENETERTVYLVFYAYPEIESLDELEWEIVGREVSSS